MVGQRIQDMLHDDEEQLRTFFSAGRSTNHRSSFLNPSLYPSSFLVSGLASHITRGYHVCSPNVVTQLARIAQATNFVYCHSIIEANRRSEYNPSPGSLPLLPCRNGEELVSAELHTFFPFDPYKLPRSGPYIQGVYREWTTIAIEGDEESDEEEDGEDVDESDGEFDHGGMLSRWALVDFKYLGLPRGPAQTQTAWGSRLVG